MDAWLKARHAPSDAHTPKHPPKHPRALLVLERDTSSGLWLKARHAPRTPTPSRLSLTVNANEHPRPRGSHPRDKAPSGGVIGATNKPESHHDGYPGDNSQFRRLA